MPKANRDAGDADLHKLFERFNAQECASIKPSISTSPTCGARDV
jgi:hypothetical protein